MSEKEEDAEAIKALASIQFYIRISTATVIDEISLDKSVLGINSKAKIKFIEDDFEDICTSGAVACKSNLASRKYDYQCYFYTFQLHLFGSHLPTIY